MKGALLDETLNDKPVFKVLRRLITQEWRTTFLTKTDASGRVAFRGFQGAYEADFGGGEVVHFEVH